MMNGGIQDFKNAEGVELNIGDQIRGVSLRGLSVQGTLSTFFDDMVVLEDENNISHMVEFKDVITGHLSDYVVVVCIKEDWDEPSIRVIKAPNEESAYALLAEDMEMDELLLESEEEAGEISIIINKVNDIKI